jgi:putative redox protein
MKVIARTLENLQVQITTDRHRFVADEPVPTGDDVGPDPYDLLLASLGACKVMTLHMYAGRKEWPLESVEVSLNTQRVHARDCRECESNADAKIDLIDCVLRLEGDLTAQQRQRLVEISERCPVHRTLTSDTHIRTKVE